MTSRLTHPYRRLAAAMLVAALAANASAQTRITADKNKYTPAQDVQIGLQAADEVRREMPLLRDERVDDYVARDNMCGGYRVTRKAGELNSGYAGISMVIDAARPWVLELTEQDFDAAIP